MRISDWIRRGLFRSVLVRPALGAEREHRGREPGFQHVGVLAQRRVAEAVLLAHFRLAAADVGLARVVEPRRDPVAPPELAAYGPLLDVLHPVALGVDPVRRD